MKIEWFDWLILAILGAGAVLAFARLWLGPYAPDRIVAADTVSVLSTAGIVLLALFLDSPLYLDVALIYGVLAFVGVIALARTIEAGGKGGGLHMTLIGNFFLLLGALFCFLGALGLMRMPDVYNRIQAGTKAVTLGSLAILIGVGLRQPEWWPKLIVVAGFILLTNPVGSSTIARALCRSGVRPWAHPDHLPGEVPGRPAEAEGGAER